MSIKLDWTKLRNIQQNLIDQDGLTPETELVFIISFSDGNIKKSLIKFKDFMSFFWSVSENSVWNVFGIVVQDKDGRVLYRHKQVTSGNEEIPAGENNILFQWNVLTVEQKEMYVRLLVAQIQGYEK